MNLSQILEVASHTDPGMVRSHNEDSIASDAASGLVVLADGMGGYNAGEVASKVTRRASSRVTPGVGGNGSHRTVTLASSPAPRLVPIQVRT